MKTIKELTQEEKYNNMLKRKNKHIKELKEDLKDYKYIGIMQFSRPYAKRYLEERRKEIPNLLYPDSEEIYIDYFDLKERIDRAIEYIEKHSNSFSVLDTISNAELLKILKGSDKE